MKFSRKLKKMGDSKHDSSEHVRLVVGGTEYQTTKATLLRENSGFFSNLLANKPHHKDNNGQYFFIDRDGLLFRHVVNFLRGPETFHVPAEFSERDQLVAEAQYYDLKGLAARINGDAANLVCVEIIETCHPEKIGVCSARIVISEDLREKAPFCEIIEGLSQDHDEYTGVSGRVWIRTEMTRLDLGVRLRQLGWCFCGMTSFNRRLPDITGKGTDLCHIVEKWIK